MSKHLHVKDLPEDVRRILDGVPSKSRHALDCIRRVHALDLTDATAHELRHLQRSATVDEPLSVAGRLLQACEREAMDAAQYLQLGCGWTGGEVLAVMQTLMGTVLPHGTDARVGLALEMQDGARLGSVDLDGWGVTGERWRELVRGVREDAELARALLAVGRLFWSAPGGSALERALRRGLRE